MNKSIAKLLRDDMYYRFKTQMRVYFVKQINNPQRLQLYNQLDGPLHNQLMMQLDIQICEANYE